jgi:hypothetical protein
VSTSLKLGLTLAVTFGIVYVLVSPLPEVNAAYSGKSLHSFFLLITCALLGLVLLIACPYLRPIRVSASFLDNILSKNCVRLC